MSSLTRSRLFEARTFPSARAGGKQSAWHNARHSKKEMFRRERLSKAGEVSGVYTLYFETDRNTLNQNLIYLPSKIIKAPFDFQNPAHCIAL